jgi:hypothetical protein
VTKRSFVAFAAVTSFAMVGCTDMSRYSTAPDESWCGSVTLGSVFRQGLSPRVQMRVQLDATKLDANESAGTISTFEAADGDAKPTRLLDEAELRALAPLAHDPLSRLSFGDGRERNAIFAVTPKDPAAESLLAIISLKTDDAVEVRLLRAGVKGDDAPAGRTPIFGVFPLARSPGRCGF